MVSSHKTSSSPLSAVRLHHLCWVPLTLALTIVATVITTYLLAVQGGLDPWFPYLSEAATFGPQAGLFSQFLDLIALLEMSTILIRHYQVRILIEPIKSKSLARLNWISSLFGLTHSVSLSSVANFRKTEYPNLHLFAAVTQICLFTAYLFTQLRVTTGLARETLESAPTSMSINAKFFLATVCAAGVFGAIHDLNEKGHFPLDSSIHRLCHNSAALLQWLSFLEQTFHLLCLANRLRMFRHFAEKASNV